MLVTRGFGVALSSDFFLLVRGRGLITLLLLPAAAGAARIGLGALHAASEQARQAIAGRAATTALEPSAHGPFVDGLGAGIAVLHLLIVTVAAHSIAADRDTGSIRQLLVRRVSRPALVLARYVSVVVIAAVASVAVIAASWGVAALLYDFTAVVEDGFELISTEQIREDVLRGLELALAPLPAAAALGLLISTAARSATGAVATALGVTLLFDLFKGLLGDAACFVYAYHAPALADRSYLGEVARLVRGYSDVFVEEGVLRLNAIAPWPEALVLLLLAVIIAERRRM